MMNTPKISILVPVYNVEKYLQTLRGLRTCAGLHELGNDTC